MLTIAERQFARELDEDFDRFPLPICFDPYEEVKAFKRREIRIKEIVERFIRFKKYLNKKQFLTK